MLHTLNTQTRELAYMSNNIYTESLDCFYVYAFYRKDWTIYYIGKGCGNRAWKKCGRSIHLPNDKDRIVILKKDMSEQEAFVHEIFLIKKYGRKDNGTGILRNRTDGGEGSSGYKPSDETKEKMREAKLGKKASPETLENMSGENNHNFGKKASPETLLKISGENNHNFGKKASPETLLKLREAKLGKKRSSEFIKNMSETRLGVKNPMYNKKLSDATKAKIAEALSGEKHPNYGKHLSDITKVKIAETKKRNKEAKLQKIIDDQKLLEFEY